MPGIIVGSVAVEVVPDATGFDERMRSALSDQKVTVKVNVDTGEAVAKMAAFRAEMDAATKDTGKSGGGGKGFFAGLSSSAADAGKQLSLMTTAVLGLGPTLIPLGAVAAGVGAAVGTAFAAVAAGGAVAALAFSGIGAAVKAADTEAIQPSKAHLAALNDALKELSPAGRSFVTFVTGTLQPAFDQLKAAAQTGLLPGVQKAFQDLMPLLPAVTNFVSVLAETMGSLAQQAALALGGPFWSQFIGFMTGQFGAILQTLGSTFGNIATGLAGLTEAFAPVTSQILGAFDHLSQRFADFATNTSAGSPLEKFVTFVQQSLPVVGKLLENLAQSVGHIATAGSGIGLTELKLISDFLGLVAKIPAPILHDVLMVVSPLVLALKAWSEVQKILNPLMATFTLIMDADPIVLIIAGIVAAVAGLVFGIVELATHWSQVWSDIKKWFDDAVKFLRSGFGDIALMILGPFYPLALLALHWQAVWDGMKKVFGDAGAFLVKGFEDLVNAVFAMVEDVLAAASHLPFIGSHFADALKEVKGFQASVDGTLSGLASDMAGWGDTAGSGLAGGISRGLEASLPSVLGTTAAVAASVAGAMRKGLQVQSPSKITFEVGQMVSKGLELGILAGAPAANVAAQHVLDPSFGMPAAAAPLAANAPYLVGEVRPQLVAAGAAGSGTTAALGGPSSGLTVQIGNITAYNPAEAALMTASQIGWQQKTRGQ